MTKDATLEGSSQQTNKDLINRRNGQSPKHLKFFLLVFSKDEVQAQLISFLIFFRIVSRKNIKRKVVGKVTFLE